MRTIIIYTTKYGFTERMAGLLKVKLGPDTSLVNLAKETPPPLELYDVVVLGGSIYFGKVQKKLTAYMTKHLDELEKKKLGLFVSAGLPDREAKEKELLQAFPHSLRGVACCMEVLGDEIIFNKLSVLDRLITRVVSGSTLDHCHVDQAKIEGFAKALGRV